MESINVEFVQNLLASYKELQESYYALQNRMAAFEAMASAKFEDYEAKLAEKDTVIASSNPKLLILLRNWKDTARKTRPTAATAICRHPATKRNLPIRICIRIRPDVSRAHSKATRAAGCHCLRIMTVRRLPL